MTHESPFFDIPNPNGQLPHHFTILDITEQAISTHSGVYFFAGSNKNANDVKNKYVIGKFGESQNFSETLRQLRNEEIAKGSTIFCHISCNDKDASNIIKDISNIVG